MSRKRRNHSPEFKSKVALAAIKGDQTLSELSSHPPLDVVFVPGGGIKGVPAAMFDKDMQNFIAKHAQS